MSPRPAVSTRTVRRPVTPRHVQRVTRRRNSANCRRASPSALQLYVTPPLGGARTCHVATLVVKCMGHVVRRLVMCSWACREASVISHMKCPKVVLDKSKSHHGLLIRAIAGNSSVTPSMYTSFGFYSMLLHTAMWRCPGLDLLTGTLACRLDSHPASSQRWMDGNSSHPSDCCVCLQCPLACSDPCTSYLLIFFFPFTTKWHVCFQLRAALPFAPLSCPHVSSLSLMHPQSI